MTGDKTCLINLKDNNTQTMTFGYGENGKIVGKIILNVKGLPQLVNVLLVNGLKANLISISQLYDIDHYVKFTQGVFQVFYNSDQCVIEGKRSSNNYYLLRVGQKTSRTTSLTSKSDEMKLRNKRMGHLNFKTLKKVTDGGHVINVVFVHTGTAKRLAMSCGKRKSH